MPSFARTDPDVDLRVAGLGQSLPIVVNGYEIDYDFFYLKATGDYVLLLLVDGEVKGYEVIEETIDAGGVEMYFDSEFFGGLTGVLWMG
jgi:hypothetical protein